MKAGNQELRKEAKKRGVFLWQIANKIGIGEVTLIRRLRFELSNEEKARIKAIIDELSKEGE